MKVERFEDKKIKVEITYCEVEELYKLFFNRYVSVRELYNFNKIEEYAKVIKLIVDCEYLTIIELVVLIKYVINCSKNKVNIDSLLSKRYVGQRRLNKIFDLIDKVEVKFKDKF